MFLSHDCAVAHNFDRPMIQAAVRRAHRTKCWADILPKLSVLRSPIRSWHYRGRHCDSPFASPEEGNPRNLPAMLAAA